MPRMMPDVTAQSEGFYSVDVLKNIEINFRLALKPAGGRAGACRYGSVFSSSAVIVKYVLELEGVYLPI